MTLLSAKGTFRKSTSENVCVNVKDGLTGVFTGVEDESEVSIGVLGGKVLRGGDDFREKCWVAGGEFGDVRVLLGLGNDKQVNGSLRSDVTERDEPFRLEHDVCGDFAVDDFAKDAHVFQSIRVTIGPAGR